MAELRWRDIAIGFSMATTSLTVVLPDLVAKAILSGNAPSLLFLWTGAFAVATSLVFFASLWPRVPVATENEFLLYRYSGNGAQVVFYFRALLMGVVIVPLMASWLLVGIECQLAVLMDWNHTLVTGCIIIVVAALIPFNALWQRIWQDAFTQVAVLLVLATAGGWLLYYYPVEWTAMHLDLSHLDPGRLDLKSIASPDTLFYLLFYWWMAFIPDLPDINGQKLMRYSDSRRALFSFGVARVPYLFLQFSLIYLAVVSAAHASNANVDSPVMSFLMMPGNSAIRWMMLVVWGGTAVAVLMNHFRWTGDLLLPFHDARSWGGKRIFFAVAPFCMTYYFWKSSSEVKTTIEWFFTIGIGVGPVFFLRWFWWRINGWSQAAAMASALIYAPVYYLLEKKIPAFHHGIDAAQAYTGLSAVNFRHVVCATLVTCTWLLVMLITKPDTPEIIERFHNTVRPGGWWRKGNSDVFGLLIRFIPMVMIGSFILGLPCSFLFFASAKGLSGLLMLLISMVVGAIGWLLLKKQQARN